ncbi:MAG TPA: BPSS1780 family membrane protein [Casimicrobiaceae bacterium]|nr:BPSS1780 family membrane protein [Casimicrobiaceae bacterium]
MGLNFYAMPAEPVTIPPPIPGAPIIARTVEAGRGTSWWSEAWRLFTAAVGPWILIAVIWVVIEICLSLIPFVGHLATQLLTPVFVGGLMLGCRAADRGEALGVNHLFAGFASHAGPLLVVGLIYTALAVLIVLIVGAILFVSFGAAVLEQLFQLQDPMSAGAALGKMLYVLMIAALLFLAFSLPLVMAVWFAPALVVLRGAEPWAAMKLSFSGCMKNVVPFLLYGLIGIPLAIVASVPLMLGWFVVGPVAIASVYTSYCDIFEDEPGGR